MGGHDTNGRPSSNTVSVAVSSDTSLHSGTAQSVAIGGDEGDADEVQARRARLLVTSDEIAVIEAIFRAGCTTFRHSPMMHIFAARYYSVLALSKHLQMSLLLRATRAHPGLEVSFLIFSAQQAVEAASSSIGGRLNALARVSFDKHLSDARNFMTRAMRSQVEFWAALAAPVPNLTLMHRISTDTCVCISAAEAAFVELTRINSTSLVVLHLYAQFCLYLTHDAQKVCATTW
jgi:hypothetical protein